MDNEKINKLAQLISNSNKTVFFGGAGVSTESGVKDFRSEDGIYNTVKHYSVTPETILSHTFFKSNPQVFFDFYYRYIISGNAKPNKAHLALAWLEANGMLSAVVTQNIDGLHQAAGSKKVYELHGSCAANYCDNCGLPFSTEDIKALEGGVPVCKQCGGIIKPDVVLYEEQLNYKTVEKSIAAVSTADLLIVGGTSLTVYPAASYLRYFTGENIVLINKSETDYDNMASLIFREPIGEVLDAAVNVIKS